MPTVPDDSASSPRRSFTTTTAPADWYLNGGSDPVPGGTLPATIIRFSGNNVSQNNTAFDNFAFAPPVPTSTCYANCDGSTAAPVLNVNDFTCFLNRYAAGCP